MSEFQLLPKLLLFLISLAFGAVVTAAFNVLAPSADQQLILATASCTALAGLLGVWFLFARYRPELIRRYKRFSRFQRASRVSVPNAITAARAPLAGCVLLSLVLKQYETAYWFYMAGLVTDVLDGMVARSIRGTTEWGKQFDAQVDVLFNGAAGLGLAWSGLASQNWARVVIVALVFSLFTTRLVWISSGWIPKYFSGFIRVVFFVLFLTALPAGRLVVPFLTGLGILLFGAWYEQQVIAESERRLRKSRGKESESGGELSNPDQ